MPGVNALTRRALLAGGAALALTAGAASGQSNQKTEPRPGAVSTPQ